MDSESKPDSLPAKLRNCLEKDQITEATLLVCSALGAKPFDDYDPDDLETVSLFCSEILPKLLRHYITWLVSNPHVLPLILEIVECARSAGYDSARCAHFILRIHCIEAFYYANQDNWDQAKIQLMLAVGLSEPRQVMANGHPVQKTPVGETLLENLLKATRGDAADPTVRESLLMLYDELKDVLSCVTKEETRSGVVRAIVVEHTHRRAVIRLLLVRIADTEGEEPDIKYLPAANEKLDEQPISAQRIALDVADQYLRENDFPDGLAGKQIFWQMLSDQDMPPQDTRAYEGDSLSVALCTAIVSEYLNQPVPSVVAMTGAFHVDSLHSGRVAPINHVNVKVVDSVKAGVRCLYLPEANKPQLDVAALKTAEEHRCELRHVRQINEVLHELFIKEVPPGFRLLSEDVVSTLREFFTRGAAIDKHPQEVSPQYRSHIWMSTFLLAILFALDWMLYPSRLTLPGVVRMALGVAIIAASILISYALPYQFVRRKKTGSWYASIFLTFGAVLFCLLLTMPDISWVPVNISDSYDWPPMLSLIKDYFIFWLFTWVYATNVFNVDIAYRVLLQKRQFRTLRNCLRWDSRHEGNMPITCFPFPWQWGALAAAGAAIFLLIIEIRCFLSLREEYEYAAYTVSIGIIRDLLFIVIAAEVLLFYKNAVAKVKRELFG